MRTQRMPRAGRLCGTRVAAAAGLTGLLLAGWPEAVVAADAASAAAASAAASAASAPVRKGAAAAAEADDEEDGFAVLRFTEFSGAVALRHLRDDSRSGVPGAGARAQADRRSDVSASVSAHGFAYHPNFLKLDLGIGGTQQRSRATADEDGVRLDNRVSRTLLDVTARGTFFSAEPHTASVSYEHLNPTVSVGPATVVQQRNIRRSLDLSLREPFVPLPVSLEVLSLQSAGRGSGLVVDDRSDRIGLTANRNLGTWGQTRLRLDRTRQESASGGENLPIARSTQQGWSATLDTRAQFGLEGRHRFTNLLSATGLHYGQGSFTPADRRDLRASFDLRSRVSATTHGWANLDLARTTQGDQRHRAARALAGGSWQPLAETTLSAEAAAERVRTSEFDADVSALALSADRRWALPIGQAQTGYTARAERRSQVAVARTTSIVGERHVLAGVAQVALDWPEVVSASVRVSNESRSQTYVEGRDYLLSPLGRQLRLQRLVTGDIVDGQSVLVDYDFATGGTFESRQLEQTLNLAWNWNQRIGAYLRWRDVAPRLVSGFPSSPLNEVRSRIAGVRAEWPLGTLWTVGANAEIERRRETVLPFDRRGGDLFLQWEEALFGPGGMRLDLRRLRVQYEAAAQDVDLTSRDFRYWLYTSQGLDLQLDWSNERDTGAQPSRRRTLGALRARWNYRQLQMTASLVRTREQQGLLETRRTVGQWLLQRTY